MKPTSGFFSITRQLQLLASTVVMIVLLVWISLELNERDMRRYFDQVSHVHQLLQGVKETRSQLQFFQIFGEAKRVDELMSTHHKFAVLLQQPTQVSNEGQLYLHSMQVHNNGLTALLMRLSTIHKNPAITPAAQQELLSRMVLALERMEEDAIQLAQLELQYTADTEARSFAMLRAMLIFTLVALLVAIAYLLKGIRSQFEHFSDAIHAMQNANDLDQPIPSLGRQNELSQLLTQFGVMRDRLKETMVSRDALQLEVDRQTALLRHQKDQLERMAHFDSLTGIANRFFFIETLNKSINRAKRNKNGLGVVFIDLDKFKPINDTYGHDAGDKVLVETASRLEKLFRDNDLVARLGGDEFVVLLDDIERSNPLDVVMEKILREVEKPIYHNAVSLSITASIGICRYPEDAQTAEALLKHSDTAMYQAKQAKRSHLSDTR